MRPALPPRIGVLALCGCAALAAAQPKSDWEIEQEKRDWIEAEVTLPPLPEAKRLIEFSVSAASSMKFFIDPQSVSVGPDHVVRYTMVVRSPAGAETVSYEGIRCATDSYRVYAFAGGEVWRRSSTEWREIERVGQLRRWHNVLRNEYFCPLGIAINGAAEGVDALRRGGHPSVKEIRRY